MTHRLVETLETFIADDPKLVFRLVTDALLKGGPSGGYQFEKMGVDLFVGIVRRYLPTTGAFWYRSQSFVSA